MDDVREAGYEASLAFEGAEGGPDVYRVTGPGQAPPDPPEGIAPAPMPVSTMLADDPAAIEAFLKPASGPAE